VNEFNPSQVDAIAMLAIAAASKGAYTINSLAMSQAARFAGLELL
jgi:hypothetical protein